MKGLIAKETALSIFTSILSIPGVSVFFFINIYSRLLVKVKEERSV